ncbi:MAG: hypothetical protein KGZ83_09495 [Sulfuricella sp.]|nr:hypothetical protein [Sulfuricella sp.]
MKRLAISIMLFLGVFLAASATAAPQASLTLSQSDVTLCNTNNGVSWNVSKTNDQGGQLVAPGTNVMWTVIANKTVDPGAHNMICANGYVLITNTGTAPATIGNIVVNLQAQRLVNKKSTWVSAAVNIADAVKGEAAMQANVVAAASAELAPANALSNSPATYTTSGQMGTFRKNAASGSLQFTDVSNNTVFSLVPQKLVQPGETVALMFSATFDNTVMKIADGTALRTEMIVSFGNTGSRGGSGASGSNIDINGDGAINGDEAYVRSVPTRVTRTLPKLVVCNNSVTLSDTGFTTDGDGQASYSLISNDLAAPVTISDTSGPYYIAATVNGSGTVTNTATLDGNDVYGIPLTGPIDPATGLAISIPMQCCSAVHQSADSSVKVGTTPSVYSFPPGACTATQGGWGATPKGNNPASVLAANFQTVYPFGVAVGSAPTYYAYFTSSSAVQDYLPAGKTANALNANLKNPTTTSSGVFGGQVLTLQLNADLTAAGVYGSVAFGGLRLYGTGGSLDGQTVSQILAAANVALGGGALPAGYTISALNNLVDKLNNSADNCVASDWGLSHLTR